MKTAQVSPGEMKLSTFNRPQFQRAILTPAAETHNTSEGDERGSEREHECPSGRPESANRTRPK